MPGATGKGHNETDGYRQMDGWVGCVMDPPTRKPHNITQSYDKYECTMNQEL